MSGAPSDQQGPPLPRPSAGPPGGPPAVATSSPPGGIQIDTSGRSSRPSPARAAGDRSRLGPWLVVGALAVGGAVVLIAAIAMLGGSGPLALEPIADVEMDELATLSFTPRLVDPSAAGELAFALVEAPEGATIDAATGHFTWTPSEQQGPGQYDVRLGVTAGGQHAETAFRIRVAEVNRQPVMAPIEPVTAAPGAMVKIQVRAEDPDQPASALTFRLLGDPPAGATIDPTTGVFTWTPGPGESGRRWAVTVAVSEAGSGGRGARRTFPIEVAGPVADATVDPTVESEPADQPEPVDPTDPKSQLAGAIAASAAAGPMPSAAPAGDLSSAMGRAADAAPDPGDQRILDLVPKNAIFQPKSYAVLRAVFADRFAREHEADLRRGLGGRREAMERWLAEHPVIREEFYTAMKPEDDVPGAVELLAELVETYPDRFPAYADLAIATSVVWDMQGRGFYDYLPHQRRTKSQPGPGRVGALESFQYLLDTEPLMEGRVRWMPWEFLTYVVDHCTPIEERRWALANYLPKRAMFGKCYHDVPYDQEMLESGSATARLNDKVYNLENIRQFGGVCAIQADFAARVGKSLGVPAAYVSGESRGGESHAGVMWGELLGVSPTQINFSLESHGRYRGDRYYVGKLIDPQINQRITDRQLELRLHTVGMSPQNKRHAALLMKAYPMIREKAGLDVAGQLDFLSRVIQLCPGNEEAWREIARMSRDGLLVQRHVHVMMRILDRLFATFARFPDFTWEIFDDLIAFQTVAKQRAALYSQLVALYVQAKRPDLACEAVLKYSDELADQKRYDEAIGALSSTILAFPDEGRYVPRMLDRLEEVCPKVRGASGRLIGFYEQLLPKVPAKRGDRPSPYCMKMYRRAIQRFSDAGRPDLAQFWQAELDKLGR